MPQDYSFDIVSIPDMQQIDDSVNVTMKEINSRFDLKNAGIKVELDKANKKITIVAPAEFQLKQAKDILIQKFAKRNISPKILVSKPIEKASGNTVREISDIVSGIDKELAKKIVKDIKELGLKVQASINDDIIRVSGKVKDDLQKVIHFVKDKDYPIPLQFTNYR